jgi:hypothetical protein
MKSRKTEIFVETEERIVLLRQGCAQAIEMVCPGCQTDSVFIAPERAALLYGLTTREIFRFIECDTIHFFETAEGATLVCAASLCTQPGQRQIVIYNPEGRNL